MRIITTSVCCLLLLATSRTAVAQVTVPGAGEDKFGLLVGGKAITVTTGENKVGVNWTNDPRLDSSSDCTQHVYGSAAYRDCVMGSVDVSQTFIELNAAITGEKGKKTFFSDGDFAPGVDAAFLVKHRQESKSSTHGGYTDYYAGLSGSTKPLTVATFVAGGVSAIGSAAEKRFGGSAGINFFVRENLGIGLGGTGYRVFSSTGTQKPTRLCTLTNTGMNENGQLIESSKCDDGFLAPLVEQNLATLRLDFLKNFTRVKRDANDKATATVTAGIIASANVEFRTDNDAKYNLAFGPTLHPKGVPHKVLMAVVFGVNDASNQGKTLRQKFSAKVFFGIPLTGF